MCAAPVLYFDTPTELLSSVQAWAERTPEVAQVWVYGSRVTGVRRPKAAPSPVPDLDIAYTLQGDEPGALLALAMEEGDNWRSALQGSIPVDLDLQLAHSDDRYVWPAVISHGLLIFDRTV
jgi:hypothetical protein